MEHDAKTIARAQFCLRKCPVCKSARKKRYGIAYHVVKLEHKLCPWCRSYEKIYQKPAYEGS